MKSIKYVFIGNPDTLAQIGSYPDKGVDPQIPKETNQIFTRVCQSSQKSFDVRNIITGKDGNYFFTLHSSNVFYLILAAPTITEREAYALIEDIHKENIPLLIDNATKKLNLVGRQQLKMLVENFTANEHGMNKINQINVELKETKELIKSNIREMTKNVDELGDLEQNSQKLKENSEQFKKGAQKLKAVTCCQNFKWTVILILVVIFLLIIILPISISFGKKKKDDDKDKRLRF